MKAKPRSGKVSVTNHLLWWKKAIFFLKKKRVYYGDIWWASRSLATTIAHTNLAWHVAVSFRQGDAWITEMTCGCFNRIVEVESQGKQRVGSTHKSISTTGHLYLVWVWFNPKYEVWAVFSLGSNNWGLNKGKLFFSGSIFNGFGLAREIGPIMTSWAGLRCALRLISLGLSS